MAKKPDYYCRPVLLPSQDDAQAFIAVETEKWWGPGPHRFTVSFMEQQSRPFIDMVIEAANRWRTVAKANVEFVWTQRDGDCRIATGLRDGYYSYSGTDNKHIARNRHTMSLSGFTTRTSRAEWLRVPTHEVGHFLGCPHEHMRPDLQKRLDREKVIALMMREQGWTRQMVIQQVLATLDERSLTGASPADPLSLMAYFFSGDVTIDGKPIPGGADFSALDKEFIARIYPLTATPPPPVEPPTPDGRSIVTLVGLDADGKEVGRFRR